MDKQKQIEELTSIIDSFHIKTYENAQDVAKFLVEKYGYRKIPENAVVLKEEEYNDYEKCKDLLTQYVNGEIVNEDVFSQQVDDIKKIRKETAEKFAEKLKEKYGKSCSEYYPELITLNSEQLNEICKEITEDKI